MITAARPTDPDTSTIRPFRADVADAELADLQRRIRATRWSDPEPVADALRGVQTATLRKLAQYWATEYDWRRCEARLNNLPQFLTEIDGVDIHFLHVRSRHANALPVIVTHGWPGSVVEQLKIVEPLTDPTAHGGDASEAFDVVIPSRPGCGFSGKPTESGWDCPRIARAWAVLMRRLGYAHYVAQGGDWGALVTQQLGVLAPPELLGIHTNMPAAVPAEIARALASAQGPPPGLAVEELHAFERLAGFFAHSASYAQQMATHPHALYGIADSPVGLAAWYLDNDLWNRGLVARAFDGGREVLTRDDLLDNITLAWLTSTALSSARLYQENKLPYFAPMGVAVPVAVSVFPDEIFRAPRSWVERAFPKLVHYNQVENGGHFAAWEQPEIFAEELRVGFRSLR
jgi:pimeloyl-ACP methyl ester carboxylesterase